MKEITEIDVLSAAKIQALIMLVIGFFMGLFTLIVSLIQVSVGFWDVLATILLVPIIYGVIGFIGGALGSWLYNKFSSRIGGIKISLK